MAIGVGDQAAERIDQPHSLEVLRSEQMLGVQTLGTQAPTIELAVAGCIDALQRHHATSALQARTIESLRFKKPLSSELEDFAPSHTNFGLV